MVVIAQWRNSPRGASVMGKREGFDREARRIRATGIPSDDVTDFLQDPLNSGRHT